MRIAVVEDHQRDRDAVLQHLEQYRLAKGRDLEVTAYEDGEYLCHDIEEGITYDLYLLDVEMPKCDGIQTAGKIREYDKEGFLIFITSHLGYAPEATEYQVFRYIDKVNLAEKLPPALNSVWESLEWRLLKQDCYHILSQNRQERIPYIDIMYLYKSGRNTVIVKRKGESKIRQNIEQTFAEMKKDMFIMIDRGCAVNLHYVMKVEGCEVCLRNGTCLPISRSRVDEVKASVRKFWGFGL